MMGQGNSNSGSFNKYAQLAPIAYNLIQGLRKPDTLNEKDYFNPEYNQAINLMANRRFDVDPLLEAYTKSYR